jgi:endonuclease/exonuclease/phosphatase family metal-dependent hydrolase
MNRLSAATLNIWNKSGPWLARLQLIRDELATRRPDVLGLQEVLRLSSQGSPRQSDDQALEIADGFGYEIAYGPATEYGNGLTMGNALLSRFPIVEQQTFELPGKESGESRSLLYTLLATPAGRLPIFVTHLNWKLHHGAVRLRQVRSIADQIEALFPLETPDLPPLLMGDFNAEPDSDEIRFLRGLHTLADRSVFYADSWWYGGDGSPGFTFDRSTNSFAAPAREPPRRIDYIFVRGPDAQRRGEPLSARLAFCSPSEIDGERVWPSDHYGLWVEIALKP